MGEAKRRGTYSQRVETAVEISRLEMEEYHRAAKEARAKRDNRAAAKVNLLLAAAIGASMSHPKIK